MIGSYPVTCAEARLNAWATWARDHRHGLGYPRVSLIYKVLRRKAMRLPSYIERPKLDRFGRPIGLLSAKGHETLSFRPQAIGEVPQPIAEVDRVVATIRGKHRKIIQTEYLTASELSLESKAQVAGIAVKEYRKLLKQAKHKVYRGLESDTSLSGAADLC